MEEKFDYKINILKAFAIALVVSGHLGLLLVPFFPTYSFHLALFFFISGYLFKEEHLLNISAFVKKKAKTLLVPYFWYNVAYFIFTFLFLLKTKIFYGKPINIKNYVFVPFINSTQLTFIIQLWFITQLFISLLVFVVIYKILRKIWNNNIFHLVLFLGLAILGIKLSFIKHNSLALVTVKTAFSMFFIYLGFYYKNYFEPKHNIFTYKSIGILFLIQSVLWQFNVDSKPHLSVAIGLSYILFDGTFTNLIIPILTSITGIWASLFLVNVFGPYLKDNKFVDNIGKNTYHIMANHVAFIYLLSNVFIWINKLPYTVRENQIYWVYNPQKTAYFYFVAVLIASTLTGMALKYLSNKLALIKLAKPQDWQIYITSRGGSSADSGDSA